MGWYNHVTICLHQSVFSIHLVKTFYRPAYLGITQPPLSKLEGSYFDNHITVLKLSRYKVQGYLSYIYINKSPLLLFNVELDDSQDVTKVPPSVVYRVVAAMHHPSNLF